MYYSAVSEMGDHLQVSKGCCMWQIIDYYSNLLVLNENIVQNIRTSSV